MATRVLKLAVAVVAAPLLVAAAGLLVGAMLAPSASWASSLVRTVDDTMLNYPPLPDDLGTLDERSTILDADGNTLSIIRDTNRILVDLDEVPEHVRNAVIATEDTSFYEHEGVNWGAITRAAIGNVQAGQVTSGGSTITQQLVKNAFLLGEDGGPAEESLDRKLQEAVYAIELERRFSKDQILERYLNTSFWGNGVYGVGTAAEFYFSKPVGELSTAEAALLAGILRAPTANNPIDNPDAALGRRDIVLGQMQRAGFITHDEAEVALAEDLALNVSRFERPDESAAVTFIIEQLKKDPALGPDPDARFGTLATSGLTVRTTINPRIQAIANVAIRDVLDGSDEISAASAIVDPRSGALLGFGFGPQPFGTGPGQIDVNPAVPDLGSPVGRQPGSAFKVFEIVAALESGATPAYTTDTPSPYQSSGMCPSTYAPGNYADSGGGVMDMAAATARSSNVYFVHLVDQVTGPEKLAETARRMGIVNSPLGDNCSNVLGGAEVFPMDMAAALGTLANQGIHCESFVIAEVVDRNGRVLSRGGDRCERAVDADVAATTTDLLRGPIENGTATRHGQLGRPAAGKTGTANDFRDAFFAGYVPQLSSAVWVGDTARQRTLTHPSCGGGVTGGCLPTMIWQRTMAAALDELDLAPEAFPDPPAVAGSTVPSVVGQPQEAAIAAVDEAGFFPIVEIVTDHNPAGQVVEQSPGGGATAPVGSAVRLSVSDGEGEAPGMPDVRGMPIDEAIAVLNGLGLELDIQVSEVGAGPDDVGLVIGTSPGGGEPIEAGQTVVLEVGVERDDDDDDDDGAADEDADDDSADADDDASDDDGSSDDEDADAGDDDGSSDDDSADADADAGDDGSDEDADAGDDDGSSDDDGDGSDDDADDGAESPPSPDPTEPPEPPEDDDGDNGEDDGG